LGFNDKERFCAFERMEAALRFNFFAICDVGVPLLMSFTMVCSSDFVHTRTAAVFAFATVNPPRNRIERDLSRRA
jgi:hypothetical protein